MGAVGAVRAPAATKVVDSHAQNFSVNSAPFADQLCGVGTTFQDNLEFGQSSVVVWDDDHYVLSFTFRDHRAGTDRSNDLVNQVPTAVSQDPEYVTIEIGANDACRSSIPAQTPTGTFRDHVEAALNTLVGADPKVYIEMLSIPDINRLWALFTSPPNPDALLRWSAFGTCQALLANPLSTLQADVDRRAAFRAQVIAYNGALADVCAEFKRCRFDNNAVFNSSITVADVATVRNTAGLPGADFWDSVPVIDPNPLDELTTTPAAGEIGRLAQLLKAAGLAAPTKVAEPGVPAPGSDAAIQEELEKPRVSTA
jgi:lysophospholipase L1-like esterase